MQEARVTIDGQTHSVPSPFLVFATQNPLESEGTYSLPEAQLDRFMFKAMVGYPSEEEEIKVLQMHSQKIDMDSFLENEVANVSNSQTILHLIQRVSKINVEPKLLQYINRIVRATRNWPTFHIGASPRAGLSLVQGARALAAFRGRDYAVPDDVTEIVLPALRHRVVLGAEAEVEGLGIDQELRTLLKTIEVPRT
jgi:MoxR-like ATPase